MASERERLELERLARQMIYLDRQIQREPYRKDELRRYRESVQLLRSDLMLRIWDRQRIVAPVVN